MQGERYVPAWRHHWTIYKSPGESGIYIFLYEQKDRRVLNKQLKVLGYQPVRGNSLKGSQLKSSFVEGGYFKIPVNPENLIKVNIGNLLRFSKLEVITQNEMLEVLRFAGKPLARRELDNFLQKKIINEFEYRELMELFLAPAPESKESTGTQMRRRTLSTDKGLRRRTSSMSSASSILGPPAAAPSAPTMPVTPLSAASSVSSYMWTERIGSDFESSSSTQTPASPLSDDAASTAASCDSK